MFRLRYRPLYEDWIRRCQQTIRAFLAGADLDYQTGRQGAGRGEGRETLETLKVFLYPVDLLMEKMEREAGEREGETRNINLLVMGKMTEDMKFLGRLSYDLGGFDSKIQGVCCVIANHIVLTWPSHNPILIELFS